MAGGKAPTCISPIAHQFSFLSNPESFYCKLLNTWNNELTALKGKIGPCHTQGSDKKGAWLYRRMMPKVASS